VTLHWTCRNENGEVLESSKAPNEPATFEVGAGNIVGNRIFEAFDEAVRGLAVGETVSIKVSKQAE
jgi:FKBP-type peptidyl-prolyl cis-trans isomerase 2